MGDVYNKLEVNEMNGKEVPTFILRTCLALMAHLFLTLVLVLMLNDKINGVGFGYWV